MRFPHARNYRSGLHGPRNDLAWFEHEHGGDPISGPPSPGPFHDDGRVKEPWWETVFGHHSRGLVEYRAGQWNAGAFHKSAELRTFGHAYDWFYVAMSHWHLGQHDQAREWYDKAAESMRKENRQDIELEELRQQAAKLLGVALFPRV